MKDFKQKKIALLLLAFILLLLPVKADEGMWIPMLLKKYNLEAMQQAGFKLSAEDIYDINQASLKDAVVGLGREGQPFHHFCTGEFVSAEGLIITNHHCAYSMIQSHTTLENNYLRNGFWARDKREELANPQITASILVRMEDVSERILEALKGITDEVGRNRKIAEVVRTIESEAVKGSNLQASVKPYFNGNQYFLSVFKIYRDVRLVGAPPSAIGKFGGDTDNWTWPRHTGDFAVLRIYAGKDNEPAGYAQDNQPYKPAKFLKVSTGGVKEGDFTMVFGYPGTTQEYLPSYAIDQLVELENPHKIKIRTAKLDVINEAMESDEVLRIKYAAKAANVANSWKKWQGEIKGLNRFGTVENKRELEERFVRWTAQNAKSQYSGIVERYRELYKEREKYILASAYATEAGVRGADIMGLLAVFQRYLNAVDQVSDWEKFRTDLKNEVEAFYKDYDVKTDCDIMAEMIRLYNSGALSEEWIPEVVLLKKKMAKKADGPEQYARQLYKKSRFTNLKKLNQLVATFEKESADLLKKDPLLLMMNAINDFSVQTIRPGLQAIQNELNRLNKTWMAGLMEMQTEKCFYPDANSTFRVSYGKVAGYAAIDAVYYKPYTTLSGIMQKDNPEIYDYDVPQRLRELYEKKDFGPYAQDGEVPVCFIATNHTTGGNSGSPVLNADGHLIGLNFDRAWEGVMSDYEYHPEICRNISVDIRYVLFIIDKYAGATHLLREMEFVP